MVRKKEKNSAASSTNSSSYGTLSFNPWKTMWLKPRETIREILEYNPQYLVLLLAGLFGIRYALDMAGAYMLGDMFNLWLILAGAIIIGPIIGIISLYISSFLMVWTGKWINGKSSYEHMRAALAWAYIPILWGMLMYLLQIPLFGSELFSSLTPTLSASGLLTSLFIVLSLLGITFDIWSFSLSLKTVSEVQGFSVWKALLNMVLVLLVVLIPLLIILTIYFLVTGA